MLAISLATALVAADGAPSAACARVVRAIPAGSVVVRGDLTLAACDAASSGFRYDPAVGFARAARDLAPGEVVRRPPDGLISDLRPGAMVTLQSRVGPVRVERQVRVLRGLPGGAVLVRSADGQVFRASAEEAAP